MSFELPRRTTFQILLLITGLTVTPSARAQQPPKLEITRDAEKVSVRGGTSKGRVWLYSTTRSFVDYRQLYGESFEILVDEDGDGAVEKQKRADDEVLEQWLALDEGRGELVATRGLAVAPGRLTADDPSKTASEIELRGRWFDVFLISKGEGVWKLTVMDGGPRDRDRGKPAQVLASFEDLEDVDKAARKPAPLKLRASDVLVVVDPASQTISRLEAR